MALCLPTSVYPRHRDPRHNHHGKEARKIPARENPPRAYIVHRTHCERRCHRAGYEHEPVIQGDHCTPPPRYSGVHRRPTYEQSHCSHGRGLRKPNRAVDYLPSVTNRFTSIQRQNIRPLSRFYFASAHTEAQETHGERTQRRSIQKLRGGPFTRRKFCPKTDQKKTLSQWSARRQRRLRPNRCRGHRDVPVH